jgi:hypothetical protein
VDTVAGVGQFHYFYALYKGYGHSPYLIVISNMDSAERTRKIQEYSNRHQFWRDKILTQLGYSINLFLTMGFGLIAFLVTQKNKYPDIEFHLNWKINWELTLYVTTLLLTSISILLGSVSVTSRLFDLRITSHLVLVRQRTLERTDKLLPDDPKPEITKRTLLGNYFRTLLYPFHRINDEDYQSEEILWTKFSKLRQQTALLGKLVWISHKLQILTILVGILLYGTTLLT